MPPVKQKSYKATEMGIVIQDRRQKTNGAIVPNYVVDLYLPIIGYDGIGILTLFYRLVKTNLKVHLKKYAAAGDLGFRRFTAKLALLEECGFLTAKKPQGVARGKHYRTVVTLFDAPTSVPQKYVDLVLKRAVTRWMVQAEVGEKGEVSFDTWVESEESNGTSMEESNGTSIMNVPIRNVPTRNVPTLSRAARARERECRPPGRNKKRESVHSLEVWIEFLEARKAAGAPINNVQAMAYARRADGEGDDRVSAWLAGESTPGAAGDPLAALADQLRLLHTGDATYGPDDLLDDLRYKSQKAGLTWDEEKARTLIGSPTGTVRQ